MKRVERQFGTNNPSVDFQRDRAQSPRVNNAVINDQSAVSQDHLKDVKAAS